MWTIYFISRLDAIVITATTIAVITGTLAIILGIIVYEGRDGKDLVLAKRCCISFIISVIVAIFTPSTNAALAMYGIGEIIDNVKENKELTNLPDKCIKALDMWLDKQLEKDK